MKKEWLVVSETVKFISLLLIFKLQSYTGVALLKV